MSILFIENIIFYKDFIYLLEERREGRDKEREKTSICKRYIDWLPLTHPMETWPAIQVCALTGNRTSDLLVRRSVLNPLSHTSQG